MSWVFLLVHQLISIILPSPLQIQKKSSQKSQPNTSKSVPPSNTTFPFTSPLRHAPSLPNPNRRICPTSRPAIALVFGVPFCLASRCFTHRRRTTLVWRQRGSPSMRVVIGRARGFALVRLGARGSLGGLVVLAQSARLFIL